MTLTLIILFIIVGLMLVWLEFFIVPGITVAGIGGTVLMLGGIYYAYAEIGTPVAHFVLLGAILGFALMLMLSFRSKTWKKTALETNVDSHIESIDTEKVKVGDEGVCISRLAPMGKVMVNGEIIEAKSKFGFVDEKTTIEVLDVASTCVTVKPLSAKE